MSTNKMARGLRNNNPLNIIKSKSQVWLGETHLGGETRFCQFSSMQYGLRAALKLLRTYYNKHGCRTIRQIICRWAPETENQVAAYIKTVCGLVQLGADAPLPPMKKETRILWCELVLAMATVECGLKAEDREALRYPMAIAWNSLY